MTVGGMQVSGDAQFVIAPFNAQADGTGGPTDAVRTVDLTGAAAAPGAQLTTNDFSGLANFAIGPDGCLYVAGGPTVSRVTNSDGSCSFEPKTQPPIISLSPNSVSPNPAQGTSQTFTASFHYTTAPLDTPIFFGVAGANPQVRMVRSDSNGQATFSYAGTFAGIDTITASATLGTTTLTSKQAVITWAAGKHTSFLTLNLSPTGVMAGKAVTLVASLSDVSVTPPAPVAGASVQIMLEGNSCFGTTNAKGNASCTLTPSTPELTSQTATFAGNSTLVPATATQQFNVTGPPTFIPTFTPGKTPTRTATPQPTPSGIAPTPTPTPSPTHTTTRTPTPTPTPPECAAITPVPVPPEPTPTPMPGHPVITSIAGTIRVGGSFAITGRNFTKGSVVNFFVATASGPINAGPLSPDFSLSTLPTQLRVPVPSTVPQGQGFVSVQVVNTDQSFVASNLGYALLQGSALAGLPSITGLDGHPLAATSSNPNFATANVETTLTQGSMVTINGNGFDIKHGIAVDVFSACTGGKLPTMFLNPGNPNLTSTSIMFTLPPSTPTGPGSIQVSNASPGGTYEAKSAAVSVPIGARIIITKVTQSADGGTITVEGAGFSALTVINFFNPQPGGTKNLGGLNAKGMARIALTLVNLTRFTFSKPAGAMTGPSFIQAFNPPFLPFTSTGDDPCAAFTLK